MLKSIMASRTRQAALAVGAVVLASTAMVGAAEAKHFKKHKHFGIYLNIGGPGFAGSYHRPYRSCGWLRKKARWTGSHYWWRKYRRCMRYNW
ncbi:MAG TPA: hypothetical protein VMX97_11420 [Hyphomicrobiaceae bacterium]|nr:hypothetical protein [Hyphomicrobiaceae bacterium]